MNGKATMKIKQKNEKGITLVALVITIVILIILATVTINVAFGDGGLIDQAKLAAEKTANSIYDEEASIANLTAYLAENTGGIVPPKEPEIPADTTPPTVEITVGETTENSITITVNATDDSGEIGTYKYYLNGTLKDTLTSNSYTFTGLTAGTEYTIKVEAYDKAGNMGEKSTTVSTESANIPTTTSYVGYYADVDGNGSVDGVIYADLAIGGSGQWGDSNGNYTIPTGSNFKKYGISQTNYTDDFGTKDVIKVTNSSGNERFYVMALDDVDSNIYCWYEAAWDYGMSDYASTTSTLFGSGKQNTKNMISKWNSSSYGAQNIGSDTDVWGLSTVQSKINENPAWYVPSKEEWSAFGQELGITSSNYQDKGLSYNYWSSSQYGASSAWYATFVSGFMSSYGAYNVYCVRLGTTF